jgi:hypothetical protein
LGGGIIGVRFPGVKRHSGATGHCGGTPHSCGSEPAPFNILPDKSGVPAETMRWICCSIKVRQLIFTH